MNWEQQRAQILATIKSKKGKIKTIMTKAATDNRSTSKTEDSDIEALEEDIAKLEKNLKRVEDIIADTEKAKNEANPVAGQNSKQAEASYNGDPEPENAGVKTATAHSRTDKGIAFAQLAKAKALSIKMAKNGSFVSPSEIAKSKGMMPRVIEALEKSAEVLDTTNSNELVITNAITDEFIELLRDKTIVDKLADKMRATPFNSTHAGMGTGTTAQWVGEGKKKPVSSPTFIDVEIKHHKLAGIAVLTDELIMLNSFSADKRVRDDLVESCVELIDRSFVDDTAQNKDRPGGVRNGATTIAATGVAAENYKADIRALRAAFRAEKLSLSGAYYVMSETRASEIADLEDPLGNPVFKGMDAGVNEKTLKGIPVLESEAIEDVILLVKPSEIYLADDNGVSIDYSDQATIEMPDGTSINLYQENKQAIRAERHITWAKRRVGVAACIDYSALPAE